MTKSLSLRIIVLVMIVILVTFSGLSLFIANKLNQNAVDSQERRLLQSAETIATQIHSDFKDDQKHGIIDSYIHNLSAATEYRITVIRTDGTVIFDSAEDPSTMENHLTRPEITKALTGESSIETRYSRTLQKQLMYAATPIIEDGKILGVVRTAYPLDYIENEMKLVRKSLLYSLLIAAMIIAILTIVSTTILMNPLKILTSQLLSFETGRRSDILMGSRKDEIGQLQRAFNNMTEQINNRFEELNAERLRLDAILNHLNDSILIVDENGTVERINQAAEVMFNVSQANAQNKSLVEIVRQIQLVELWKACVTTGKQQTTTVETSPDRTFLQGIASPITWGEQQNFMLIFQDLTRIHQLESIRKDFVSNVSHELRTPLSSLKALTETLQDTVIDEPQTSQKFLTRMNQELDNLTQLVNELLELSRLESGKVPLDRKVVSPSVLLQAVEDRMKLQAERNGIDFSIDFPETIPDIVADPSRIEQVFTNLVHNAIKFTPPGGKITIHSQSAENQVIFIISDTGIGISQEMLPRIFERFYKADRSRASTGAGLGLSISKHVIESHGGKIWAESEPGIGTNIYFTLPNSLG